MWHFIYFGIFGALFPAAVLCPVSVFQGPSGLFPRFVCLLSACFAAACSVWWCSVGVAATLPVLPSAATAVSVCVGRDAFVTYIFNLFRALLGRSTSPGLGSALACLPRGCARGCTGRGQRGASSPVTSVQEQQQQQQQQQQQDTAGSMHWERHAAARSRSSRAHGSAAH
jgi:hypothetical protein